MEINQREIAQKSPLSLALVGDAFLTLFWREQIVRRTDVKVGEAHRKVSELIKAKTQNEYFNLVKQTFTEVEEEIANRARNAKHHSTPKNCTLAEYRGATAFEAVIGYNYLIGDIERCIVLTNRILAGPGGEYDIWRLANDN